jgi:hypothetical protein
LTLQLVQDLAHGLRRLVVLPGDIEEVLVAVLARQLMRPGVGGNEELAGVQHRPRRRQQNIGPDVAGDEIDIVQVDELVGLLLADLRLEAVVLVDHLEVEITHLAAHVLDREIDGILLVIADHRGRCGERGDEADLDGIGEYCRKARAQRERGGQSGPDHRCSSLETSSPLLTVVCG